MSMLGGIHKHKEGGQTLPCSPSQQMFSGALIETYSF